ncbi:MAG: hypothetical protein ABI875_08160 [Gemmatimonadales bacterium]
MLPLSESELDDLVARERERGFPPLTDWSSLSAQLRAEGLINTPAGGSRFAARHWMQVAAAIMLVAGGAAVGRYTFTSLPATAPAAQMADVPSSSAHGSPVNTVAESQPAVNASNASSATAEFHSPEEAWATLNRAGEEYQRASAYLSASNTQVPMPTTPGTYRTRLAALDNVMSDMRTALHESPHDPVINQYYLATVGAREATLRQLGTTLPAGAKLNRF